MEMVKRFISDSFEFSKDASSIFRKTSEFYPGKIQCSVFHHLEVMKHRGLNLNEIVATSSLSGRWVGKMSAHHLILAVLMLGFLQPD